MAGNQYQVDPRQALFLKYYLDPKSDTFSNGLQSGLKAGYSQEYSETILSQDLDWLSENLKAERMVNKAERNLEEALDMPVEVQKIEGYGEDKQMVVKTEPSLVKIKVDTSKFVAERLGKKKWSERQELTGADGKELNIQPLLVKIIECEQSKPTTNSDGNTNGV